MNYESRKAYESGIQSSKFPDDHMYYLKVPYAEKDEAKALGAMWDSVRKQWFVSENIIFNTDAETMKRFTEWLM